MDFTIKQGDTRTVLKATLYNPSGSVVDLTGATAQLVLSDQGTRLLTKQGTVQDAINGIVWFSFATNDLSLINGWVKGEIKITTSDGKSESYPNNGYLKVNVVKSL